MRKNKIPDIRTVQCLNFLPHTHQVYVCLRIGDVFASDSHDYITGKAIAGGKLLLVVTFAAASRKQGRCQNNEQQPCHSFAYLHEVHILPLNLLPSADSPGFPAAFPLPSYYPLSGHSCQVSPWNLTKIDK